MRRKAIFLFFVFFPFAALAQSARDNADDAERLVKALDLRAGSVVGEIGAGSGELTVLLAKAVGETGRVFSNELNAERRAEIASAAGGHPHPKTPFRSTARLARIGAEVPREQARLSSRSRHRCRLWADAAAPARRRAGDPAGAGTRLAAGVHADVASAPATRGRHAGGEVRVASGTRRALGQRSLHAHRGGQLLPAAAGGRG